MILCQAAEVEPFSLRFFFICYLVICERHLLINEYFFLLLDNDRVQDDIHHFLFPLEKITVLDENAIVPLVELLKTDLDEIKLGALSLRTVLMSLRLLRHLTREEKHEGLSFNVLHIENVKLICIHFHDIFKLINDK